MFKDVRSLKAFIAYCKKEKITKVKVGEIELEFGDYTPQPVLSSQPDVTELSPEELKKQEEEDLFWSVGGTNNRI